MNLIESEKDKFNENWWRLLSHHFSKNYMKDIYNKIQSDSKIKDVKILPSSNDIYQRFKLINPDDVRIVFITQNPIGSYKQSVEWQKISRMIEYECFDGLWLNTEENLDYKILDGIINLSSSLTICNKSDHTNIGWLPFVLDIMNILQNTGNKILFVCDKSENLNIFRSKIIAKNRIINLEDGCFSDINYFLQKEYNLQIKW